MEKSKEEKILAISEKIVDLQEQLDNKKTSNELFNKVTQEITLLQIEKDDIINGTNNLEIKKQEIKIEELNKAKEQSGLIKRIKYVQRINKAKNDALDARTGYLSIFQSINTIKSKKQPIPKTPVLIATATKELWLAKTNIRSIFEYWSVAVKKVVAAKVLLG